ncbi:cytochrome P450 [Ilyonectria sp. MPI-CAGE-AT-0026]|nr:cytochrome P450 [Ilyonectria sp. MPI-CAGE-AT-0026]
MTQGLIFLTLGFVLVVIYNLYVSPLQKFPGPKSAAATPLPYLKAVLTGRTSQYVYGLHQKYGDIVRIGPRELSYTKAEAWKDIYGHRSGHELFLKEPAFYMDPPNGIPSLFSSDHKYHPRLRRPMAHAFSEKALRSQEPLMRVYIDLLIQGLRDKADTGEDLDIVSWFNWTTFDIIGDLSFGEPFDCLKTRSTHPWVKVIFDTVRATAVMGAIRRAPGAQRLIEFFIPKGEKELPKRHQELTDDKVARRLNSTTDRPDFIHYLLKNKDKQDALTDPELSSALFAVIVGGSETTATLLSGCIYLLLRNPDKLQKLVDEVRQTFKSDDEINSVSANQLKYTLAVLDESMRVYPPVPIGMPREVPKGGDTILGEYIPGGTIVSVHQYASHHSPDHFRDPETFAPERFMGDPYYADDDRKVFQPFSIGARNCIGRNLAYAEMRPILARIVYNFDLELSDEEYDWTGDQRTFIIWEKGPLKIKVRNAQKVV